MFCCRDQNNVLLGLNLIVCLTAAQRHDRLRLFLFTTMDKLVRVDFNKQGEQVVSARDLYAFLEVKEKFTDWIKRMLAYGFKPNVDYLLVSEKKATNNPKNPFTTITDYALILDCAKNIGMIQNSEKGRQIREYFIKCEKELISLKTQSQNDKLFEGFLELKKHYERGKLNEHKIPISHFAMIGEMVVRVLYPLQMRGYDLVKDCLPDGSLGRGFMQYLQDIGADISLVKKYQHEYPDGRIYPANLYPNEFYGHLKEFVFNVWLNGLGAKYFNERAKLLK